MEAGIIVRPYDGARDRDALRACIIEHQDVHRALEPSWPTGAAIVDDYTKYLERECNEHDGCVFVAEHNGEIVGFVCVVASTAGSSPDDPAPHAWIHDIFVRPAHRRGGIATGLMAYAEAYAKARGSGTVRLGVLDRNEAARALYRRLGYRDYVRVLTKPIG